MFLMLVTDGFDASTVPKCIAWSSLNVCDFQGSCLRVSRLQDHLRWDTAHIVGHRCGRVICLEVSVHSQGGCDLSACSGHVMKGPTSRKQHRSDLELSDIQ